MNKAYQGERRPHGELEVLLQCGASLFTEAGDTGYFFLRALGISLCDPVLDCVFVSDLLVGSNGTHRDFKVFRGINKPCGFEVEVIGVLHRNKFKKEKKRKEKKKEKKVLTAGKDELKSLTINETTTAIIPPTPIAAKFPANIS